MSPSNSVSEPTEGDAAIFEQAAKAAFDAMERMMSNGTSSSVSDLAI